MIKTLSPYYLEFRFLDPIISGGEGFLLSAHYNLKIYVWSGLKSNVPLEPVYSITKQNPTYSTNTEKINISRFLNDYIDFAPQNIDGILVNGNNQMWCKVDLEYTTTTVLLTYTNQSTLITDLFVKGYGYGMEGQNPQTPTNRVLLRGREFNVSRTGNFIVPVKILEA